MSAPLIWIVLPMAAGLLFWLFRERVGLVTLLSTVLCLLLALLAWLLPVDQRVVVGPLRFLVDPTLDFVGRRLVLDNGDKVFLAFIYIICAFWFAGSYAARASILIIPFGLGIAPLLIAALAVEPFLYAALLVEMAVLLSVPLLVAPGKPVGRGVLRFLIFQTLAMPFILLAGWALGGVEANPSNQTLVTLAAVFLGLGFAFWLAIFPFYTWIPMLAEESSPYVSVFLILILQTVNLLLGLRFLDNFGWLRSMPGLFPVLSQIGTLMIVTAGLWAAFQKDLARLVGYGVIVETGFSILAVSLSSQVGQQLFTSMFLPRVIGFGLWALSLTILLRDARSARFEHVEGLLQQMPFATAGLAVASLSLGGLPLLAEFPIRHVVLEGVSRQSLFNGLWALVGSIGILFSAFRSLAVLSRGRLFPQVYGESRLQIGLLLTGMVCLIVIGIFPQAFSSLLTGLISEGSTFP